LDEGTGAIAGASGSVTAALCVCATHDRGTDIRKQQRAIPWSPIVLPITILIIPLHLRLTLRLWAVQIHDELFILVLDPVNPMVVADELVGVTQNLTQNPKTPPL
jgi:hypothetical protein